jgi:hypothetical protein
VTTLALTTVETDLNGALELGGRALAWTETHGRALLASASFTAQALVLGSLQREDTLQARSPARFDGVVARRFSTGTEAQLEGAVLYNALTLPRVDTLFGDASARTLLNRNMRAFMRGYAAAGVPFRYFGTEVLAVLGHPVALIGYDQSASGAVLIEVLIGLENPGVVRPALKREPPAALYPLLRRSPPAHDLLLAAVAGIVDRLGLTSSDVAASLPPASATANRQPPTANSSATATVSIPLGVVEAVVTPTVLNSGDLLVGRAALSQVEALAQTLLASGQPISEACLTPMHNAPLDGARLPDLLQALRLAVSQL